MSWYINWMNKRLKRDYKYHCKTCNNKLQKNGHSANKRQLWKCPNCHTNRVSERSDLVKVFGFHDFLEWLLGKNSQSELSLADRTFRHHIAWCWNVSTPNVLTGEIHAIIVLDGICVGRMVCLIARTPKHTIAWIWTERENSQNWSQLLNLLPAPSYVICDGQKGILKAIHICWPNSVIQRCHYHVRANIRTKLTMDPQTKPAQDLAKLMSYLHFVYTVKQRDTWVASFCKLMVIHVDHLTKRTWHQNHQPGQRHWWYTHGRDRSAFRQINTLIRDGSLFCYVDNPNLIPRATSLLEGGTNSLIRRQLGYHRGLSNEHQRVLTNWLLYYQTEEPKSSFFGR